MILGFSLTGFKPHDTDWSVILSLVIPILDKNQKFKSFKFYPDLNDIFYYLQFHDVMIEYEGMIKNYIQLQDRDQNLGIRIPEYPM